MLTCIVVGLGGFLGSVLRYLLGLVPVKFSGDFTANTLIINLIGAFLIGIIAAVSAETGDANARFVLFLKVGLCGGFTTFSTFSLECVQMFQSGKVLLGIAYIILSVLGCVAGILLAEVTVNRFI